MIKIGIICPSEIAFRRFLPALQKNSDFKFVGVAIASPYEWFGNNLSLASPKEVESQQKSEKAKAEKFIDSFGGRIFESYRSICSSKEIDSIYIPLPPALHFKWAKISLMHGKNVFVEKPATINANDTKEIISLAKSKGLVLHENYMFLYHDQIKTLDKVIASGEVGEIRLFRLSFGFPRREISDFRYNKNLGGGALIDAGGYTIKYADYLLGDTAHISDAHLNYISEFDVDMYGSATIINQKGDVAQISFGMDNDYKCEIEIWGSKGIIESQRILTAPPGFAPTYMIKKNQEIENRLLPEDDAFYKSIAYFKSCIRNHRLREDNYEKIQRQADLISQFLKKI